MSRFLSAGEVNPDVRAGSCSAQQGNGLLRLQRVRADEPAETHAQTGRQEGRETDRREGRGRQPVSALSTLCGSSRAPSCLHPEPPPICLPLCMGGKQSTAGRPRGAFPGVSTDDSAVPPSAHFGHYRPSGTMGLRSRSVSSVAGMGIEHSPAVPFGFYTPRGTDTDRAGGGSGGTTAASHGTGYQDTGGGGHHTDGVLYLGSRGSLADTLPLHIAPRWFSAHSGKHAH